MQEIALDQSGLSLGWAVFHLVPLCWSLIPSMVLGFTLYTWQDFAAWARSELSEGSGKVD